jgi:hypothetical protein
MVKVGSDLKKVSFDKCSYIEVNLFTWERIAFNILDNSPKRYLLLLKNSIGIFSIAVQGSLRHQSRLPRARGLPRGRFII